MDSKPVSTCPSSSDVILTFIALSDFAPRVEEFTEQLLTRISDHQGRPVPLHEYMSFYTYDTMGALAFGKPMGFIKGEQDDEAQRIHDMMTGTLAAFGLMQHIPWLLKVIDTLGSLAGPMKEWRDWSVKHMQTRMAVSSPPFHTRTLDLIRRRQKTPNQISYLTSLTTLPTTPQDCDSFTVNPASSSLLVARQPRPHLHSSSSTLPPAPNTCTLYAKSSKQMLRTSTASVRSRS
jgi:hypothetical protein